MSDIAQLEQKILGEVAAAKDEPALEAVRVAALGKSGSITALLKTLGALSPDQRKSQGPLINGLKDRVNAARTAVADNVVVGGRHARRPQRAVLRLDREWHADRCPGLLHQLEHVNQVGRGRVDLDHPPG